MLIARTDSRTSLGLDEALRQSEAFKKAGADVVFVEAPEAAEEMKIINDRIGAATLANMVSGGRTTALPSAELQKLDFAIGIHLALAFLAVGHALKDAYGALADSGDVSGANLEDFGEFSKLMAFKDAWEFDKNLAEV